VAAGRDILIAVTLSASCGGTLPASRLSRIRPRGALVCGVFPGIAGFAQVDGQGHYSGFDVDICRAVAAAILGTADRVQYKPVASIDFVQRDTDIDIVSRRLTWTLRREGMHVLFGLVTFYDGQGFLVPGGSRVTHAADLANVPVCVAESSEHDVTLMAYFKRQQIALNRVAVADGPAGGRALTDGRCQALSADVSELASVRSAMQARPRLSHPRRSDFAGAALAARARGRHRFVQRASVDGLRDDRRRAARRHEGQRVRNGNARRSGNRANARIESRERRRARPRRQ